MERDLREQILKLFREHGVIGQISQAVPEEADEAVFVVSPKSAAEMRERELTMSLMSLLRKKVWITTDGDHWKNLTKPL
ncbi:MAG: hypothetical protein E6I07_08240 [Chloroflexi bacterium]|nr:MAG: hypothetical protein E6I07_08240 [Chloroflexota bacterium]